ILEKALVKSKEINDTNSMLLVSNNLGFLRVKQTYYKDAEALGLEVLKQSNDKEFAIHKANANRLLGTVYYYLGDYQKATAYIDNAIVFFRNFKNPELLRNTFDIKNKLLLKTQQFEDAAIVNSEIISMLDSVNLSKNVQSLQRELVAYETEKKDSEIIILKQKEDINAFKIEKQKQQIQFLGIGLIAVLLFGSVVFWYQKKINTIQNLSLRSKLTRSQFNPHYINNAFTSLQAELVDHNFDENLIDYTSNISRFSRLLLESTFKDEWSLYEEKQMMENYLKTQQYRMQGGFEYNINSSINPEEFHKLKIPSAITQSVLENAIEHGGFKNNSSEGLIDVFIEKIDNQLHITIKNNIIGEPITIIKKSDNEPSRGLDITKQRILLHSKIYRKLADFKFLQSQNTVEVEFNLPIITA
ncbi:MAG: histidine kinase, partial [Gelidibacter sp.]|nr:histidine kinase [Gelidibacter sp.]